MSEAEDAARYRWLKETGRIGRWRIQRWEVETGEWNADRGRGAFETVLGDQLDEAIDEAMRTVNGETAR